MDHLSLELAQQYLHGTLAPPERDLWLRHIAGCERCRAFLDAERQFTRVLELGDTPQHAARSPESPPPHVLLDPRRRRRAAIELSAWVLGCLGLSALLAWQIERANPAKTDLREAADRFVLESRVVANLPALEALHRDPWLIDDYEAVQALDELMADAEPPGP